MQELPEDRQECKTIKDCKGCLLKDTDACYQIQEIKYKKILTGAGKTCLN